MPSSPMSSGKSPSLISLTSEIEGDRDSTSDFVFVRIGASFPIKASDSSFDLQNPPSQPLAISQRHRLLFVSHSQGFLVAKTADVIDAAREIKGKGKEVKAVENVSVVDVKIGRVSILTVSGDESMLAAVVGGEIFFFVVLSLLNKEQEPLFSCSLNSAGTVKDFKWQKSAEKSFVVLSSHGSLYHGILQTELKKLMDNVDAVDWSPEGGFIVVARKHTIMILSSNFKEVLGMSLVFESWKHSTDSDFTIRVDSVKWLRDDSIIVGCFQVNEDCDEEGYFVQVIKSKKQKLSEVSCDPVVYSFPDLFDGVWDILPIGCGPYLLASYLDYWEVVVASNQKAIDQHISLLKWSAEDNTREVVALEFCSDKYTPKIEVPENDDDNLVLGFCIEKFSSYDNIEIQVDQTFKELSPCYVLLCLTSEGKLNLFHAARISEPSGLPQPSPSLYYNDVVKEKLCTLSSTEGSIIKLRLEDSAEDTTFQNRSKLTNTPAVDSHKDLFVLQSEKVSTQKKQEDHELQVGDFTGQVGKLNKSSTLRPAAQGSIFALRNEVKPGINMFSEERVEGTFSSAGKMSTEAAEVRLANTKGVVDCGVVGKEVLGSPSIGSGPFGPQATGVHIRSDVVRASPSNSTLSRPIFSGVQEKTRSNNDSHKIQSAHQLFSSKDSSEGFQSSIISSGKITQNKGHSKLAPIVQGSDVFSQEGSLAGKFRYTRSQYLHEDVRASRYRQMLDTEPDISKQFYNVKDMTQELDTLLSLIEKEGGFKDACTTFQRNSLLALEDGLRDLSERTHMCRKNMEVQLLEIPQLQNKMLQVSARQGYAKGVVEQASNKKYWDIWNRLKLNPELEAKRQNVLNMNQNLTSQIIELERHFNNLEINRFGESGRTSSGHTVIRSVPSRQTPSLQSVYNTVNSQIAAAEHLSDCLSKLMSDLNLNSAGIKHKGITKELFESIGLSHEATSFQSPVCKRTSLSSDSIMRVPHVAKEHTRKQSSSVVNTCEPETARRRRDSLDRDWATFEPPKTTVKRTMQLQPSRVSEERPFRKAKETFDLQMEAFAVQQKSNRTCVSSSSSQYLLNEGMQHDRQSEQVIETRTNSVSKWAKDISGSSQNLGSKSLPVAVGTERAHGSPFISSSASISSSQSNTKGFCGSPGVARTEEATHAGNLLNPLAVKATASFRNIFNAQYESGPPVQKPSSLSSHISPTSIGPLIAFSDQANNLTNRGNTPDLPNTRNTKYFPESSSIPSENTISSPSTVPAFNGNATTKNRSGEPLLNLASHSKTSCSTPFSMPVTLSSSTVAPIASTTPLTPTTSAAPISFGKSLLGNKAAGITNLMASESSSTLTTDKQPHPCSSFPLSNSMAQMNTALTPSSSSLPDKAYSKPEEASLSTPSFAFSNQSISSSNTSSQSQTPSSTTLTSLSTSLGTPVKLAAGDSVHLDKDNPKAQPCTTTTSSTSVEIESTQKTDNSLLPRDSVSTPLSASVSQPDIPSSTALLSTTTSLSASVSQPDIASSTALLSTTNEEKDKGLDVSISQEDEMDEEAPDTSSTLSLGSLGAFGLGTAATSGAPKPSPFGGSFLTATSSAASSPFTFPTSPGEPFRPASFSLPSTAQPVQASSQQPASSVGGFSGFGQPTPLGVGQQALGSVLGSFGQSRQIGSGGLPGASFPSGGFSPAAANTGGFASAAAASAGGFSSAAGGGGFAAAATKSGGFAALAQGSGGFGGAGFASGGFASFGGNQGGFSGFAGNGASATGKPPASLLTQMRK